MSALLTPSTLSWPDSAGPAPALTTPRTTSRPTYGGEVAQLAEFLGRPFMPWQKHVADVALEVDEDGLFVYKLVIITVPRQSGKTLLNGAVMSHRALIVPRARVWFTMQSQKDAVDWLINEWWPVLSPLGDAVKLRRMAGSEWVRWRHSAGLVRPFPPNESGLHGKTSDDVAVDECWNFGLAAGRAIDQAIVPTQATRPNAQTWKFSTAGTDESVWWNETVERGRAAARAGRSEGLAYFEWSCPENMDPCDPESWPLFHPAFERTIDARTMHAALEQLGPEEFARAFGNQGLHSARRVIPTEGWYAAADPDQELPAPGDLSLAFDVAVDRSDATIVAAWRDGAGVGRVEVAEHRPAANWVASRLVELVERWKPRAVGYDHAGPALDVADEAERLGVDLTPLKSKEYVAACAGVLEAFSAPEPLIRYRPHPALDDAAAAATQRVLGDSWAWGRRSSRTSISPLTAATVALWAHDHAPAPQAAFRVL